MRVILENLSQTLGSTQVLHNLSLEIQPHELYFLLGPSGCGKTTLLRMIAGFYQPDQGHIRFGERVMDHVPPHQRNTGMVFQTYALWPHLSVADNVAYGLEVRKMDRAERQKRVAESLEMVHMGDQAEKMPNQLSGGQQQRVALARALVIHPDVLLLDEPLSNLDAKLRLEMREEIRRIHDQTRITTLYVTHDQKEALSMADRMAILHRGILQQAGQPREVYRSPANRFVADFIGEVNWLEAIVEKGPEPGTWLRHSAGLCQVNERPNFLPGTRVWTGFRPETVRLDTEGPNRLEAVIEQVSYLGEIEQYRLRLASGAVIKAFEQNPQQIRKAGSTISFHVPPDDWLVYPLDSSPAS